MKNIAVIYSAPKMGDLIWQLPYIKAISKFRNKKIILYIHEKIKLQKYLEQLPHIEKVKFNGFNRGKNFFVDLAKLKISFEKNFINEIYLLEKTKCAAIAAFLAGVKNRISFGIGVQKIFLTNKNFLSKNDLKISYPAQSDKFLKINKIPIEEISPELEIKHQPHNKILSITIDSLEKNRFWPLENFAEIINKIINLNFFKKINIISLPERYEMVKYILKYNNFNKVLFDCSQLNFEELIETISESSIFLSNDTGPANVSAAFGIPTIVIIGPTDETALRSKNMIKILSDSYNKNRECGNKRHGDNFDQTNLEISSIKVERVYNEIIRIIDKTYAS